MAKRKQFQPVLSAEIIRRAGLTVIVVISAALLIMAAGAYVGRAPMFTVREVYIPENLKGVDIPDLARLKGLNILKVDIVRVEAKLRAKYPQLSGLHVMRRFPDQIAVAAFKRIPFAQASLNSRAFVVDREGFLIGAVKGEEGPLTLVKGLKRQQPVIGDAIDDVNFAAAVRVMDIFARDGVLSKVPLRSVDVGDKERIVCVIGGAEATFEVFVDGDDFRGKAGVLATLLSHHEVDLANVKYIDMRFKDPTISPKKASKP